jgi:hypothetical protein
MEQLLRLRPSVVGDRSNCRRTRHGGGGTDLGPAFGSPESRRPAVFQFGIQAPAGAAQAAGKPFMSYGQARARLQDAITGAVATGGTRGGGLTASLIESALGDNAR